LVAGFFLAAFFAGFLALLAFFADFFAFFLLTAIANTSFFDEKKGVPTFMQSAHLLTAVAAPAQATASTVEQFWNPRKTKSFFRGK